MQRARLPTAPTVFTASHSCSRGSGAGASEGRGWLKWGAAARICAHMESQPGQRCGQASLVHAFARTSNSSPGGSLTASMMLPLPSVASIWRLSCSPCRCDGAGNSAEDDENDEACSCPVLGPGSRPSLLQR